MTGTQYLRRLCSAILLIGILLLFSVVGFPFGVVLCAISLPVLLVTPATKAVEAKVSEINKAEGEDNYRTRIAQGSGGCMALIILLSAIGSGLVIISMTVLK